MFRRLWKTSCGSDAARDLERDEESHYPLNDDASKKMFAAIDEISMEAENTAPRDTHTSNVLSESTGSLKSIFLECGIDINELTDRQSAISHPVHWAVRNWKNPLLLALLEKAYWKAKIEDADEKGMHPLHAAAEINNLEAFKILQSHGGDINAYRSDRNCGDQPIHSAAFECSMAILKYLIPDKKSVDGQKARLDDEDGLIGATNRQGQTVLHCAVYSKKKASIQNACIKYLLEHGAAVDVKDKNKGETPLHLACRKCLLDVVKLMAEIRPDQFCKAMHMTTAYGQTPRDLAWKGPISMVTLEDQQVLMQFLLDSGLPCDMEGAEGGGSALRLAAENGDEEMVERLLSGGALIFPDEQGRTAFLNATAGNHVSIMRSIYSKFGRTLTIDAIDKVGNTALHYAAANDAAEATSFLLSLGAKIKEDSTGRTPMDLAIFHKSQQAALAFVEDFDWKKMVMQSSIEYDSVLLGFIQHLPDVMMKCLDKCMDLNKNLEDPDKSYIQYDLTIFYPPKFSEKSKGKERPEVYMAPMRALEAMANYGRDQLLAHPLCISLLERKWIRYGMLCSALIILANLAVVILLTYILMAAVETDLRPYLLQKAYKNVEVHSQSSLNSSAFDELHHRGYHHGLPGFKDNISLSFLALSLIIIFFMEGINLFTKGWRYFKDWINYVGFLLFLSCGGFLISFHLQGQHHPNKAYTYQFGAVAVFLAWFNLMRCCRPFGTFGIYSIMFFRILKTLLEVLFFFILLIAAFAAAFCVLFQSQIFPNRSEFYQYQSNLEPVSLRTGHDNMISSAFRIGAMTTGELDFLGTFLYPFLDGMLEYPVLTAIFYAIFLMLMPILLNNLLIGLAVGDMDVIRTNAAALRREIQVNLHCSLEKLFPATLLRKFQDENISYKEYPEEKKTLQARLARWLQSGSKQSDDKNSSNQVESSGEMPVVLSKRSRQLRLKALDPSMTKLERELEPEEILYYKLKELDLAVQAQAKMLAHILEELQRRPSDKLQPDKAEALSHQEPST